MSVLPVPVHGPLSTGTCRSSVTGCRSTGQQLHRAVGKHRVRIKGGGRYTRAAARRSTITIGLAFLAGWRRDAGMRRAAAALRLLRLRRAVERRPSPSADAFVATAADRRACPSPLATPPCGRRAARWHLLLRAMLRQLRGFRFHIGNESYNK